MTLLFCVDRRTRVLRLTPLLCALRGRGHRVEVWIDRAADATDVPALREAGVTVQTTARPANDHWAAVMRRVWALRDYVTTLDRRWADAPAERHAAKSAAPSLAARWVEATPLRYRPGRRIVAAVCAALERAAPVSAALADELKRLAPDVVVVTPALRWGYVQGDYLFAAARLGLRSVVLTDGPADVAFGPLLRPRPVALMVWNERESAAAVERDRTMRDRVIVTGAPTLTTTPAPPAAPSPSPFVLYLASDLGKASASEPALWQHVERALRDDDRTRALQLVARPHPRVAEYSEPSAGGDVDALLGRAAVVVGVQNRLLAEAAIAGRPVIVIHPNVVDCGARVSRRLTPIVEALPTAESVEHAVELIAAAVAAGAGATLPDRIWRPQGDPVARAVQALETIAHAPTPAPAAAGLALLVRPMVATPVAVRRAADWRRRWTKESKRVARKTKDRAARNVRRGLRTIAEKRLAMRAFVLGTGADREVVELEAARVARETISEIARSGRPIVVGPWLSEAGFELLYWIPFVRWAKTYGNIREDRFIVVSRGGAAPWYADVASRYVDLFSLYGVDEVRARNEARIDAQGGQKQRGRAGFEREIFERAMHAAGVSRAEWLHPSLMYNLFNLFWMQRAPASLVQRFTIQRRLPMPDAPLPEGLPTRFVAAKFYTNASFPDTDANRQFVHQILRRLCARHDVVLLNTGMTFDDHGEFTPAESRRLHLAAARLRPDDNLRLQTQIVAAADAYVGTYGGFSYVAPLCGTDAVTFYSEPSAFRHDHLEVAKRVFEEIGGGRFVAARTNEMQFLDAALGGRAGRVAAAS